MLQRFIATLFFIMIMPLAHAGSVEPIPLELAGHNDVLSPTIKLSNDDLLWLAKKHKLTVAVYPPELPPLALSSLTGRYRGINADYLALLQKALNTTLDVKRYPDQQQALAAVKSRKVDLLLTPQTGPMTVEPPFIASEPMVRAYPVLVTRQDEAMQPLQTDNPVSIAITGTFPSDAFIKQSFPQARIVSFDSEYAALASVVDHQNDYFMGNNLTSNMVMARDFPYALSVIKFWKNPQASNRFIALDSEKPLVTILNTFLSQATAQIHHQDTQFWVDGASLSGLSHPLSLTPQEKRWLEKHPTLRVLINPYYAPFTMVGANSEMRGLIGDILNLIHLKTGLAFEPVIVNSNNEMAKIIAKGDWDILPASTYSVEREDFLSFTHPFITTPFVAVVKDTPDAITKLSDGMKIAIPAYHTLFGQLKSRYPNIEWVIVDNTSVALNMVDDGRVDASIYNLLSARYMIDHYYPGKLKYFRIADETPALISFAIPRGDKELQQILNKALDDIPQKEILRLAAKWAKMPKIQIDTWNLYNTQFYLVIALAALLVFSSLLWGLYLSREIRMRKKSQSELETQLRFRQTLSNAIPMPVYVISLAGELQSYNNAFSAFFSPALRKEIRPSLFDNRHPLAAIFSIMRHDVDKGLAAGAVLAHHLILNNGQEERHILHWLTLCRMPANVPPTLICGWQDITESKQLMQALQIEKDKAIQANQAKSTFLASMSHEIRTPISTIMGFLELLSTHNQPPDEENDAIQLAYGTAQHLLGLIGDILDMEKIESGNFEPAPEWVDVELLLANTLKTFEGLAKQKSLQLTSVNRLVKGEYLWLDPQALRQVLSNFLSNAIKFTQQGSIEVRADTQSQSATQTQLTLSVTDTGPGISEEDQQQLFKPFSQTAAGRQQTGSGLGLMICRELILRMGGEISMFSQPGQGTTLTVTLTLPVSCAAVVAVHAPEATDRRPQNITILIADDHPNNRLLLRRQLDKLGYQVDEAIDGIQALALIKQNTYDLLITDINMPNMDGINLTRHIRDFDKEIVIWGLTANAQVQEKERCLAVGMNLCLFKPVNLQQLESLLCVIVNRQPISRLGELIDLDLLKTLTMSDAKLMQQMLTTSQLENDKDLALAKEASRTRDWAALQHHLHRINGSAQILGATALLELCEQMENYPLTQIPAPIVEEGLRQLEKQLKELSDEIDLMTPA
ncbi:transporter substrate-binding domain-containing protein [Yersinia intermedia]|uniref:ATP-binding protein n=1 Tax=Yersinia intermedia TaxID=631 RepID=UPI0022FDEBDF|nr:transporter substrate-binding domain-containing protein [Yersinia intermedia]MDA5495932.1 transporter substrate-binding domain-containing protein [Yersinia intermedia]